MPSRIAGVAASGYSAAYAAYFAARAMESSVHLRRLENAGDVVAVPERLGVRPRLDWRTAAGG